MKNQFWAVGRWSGLDCEIKGSGPIMSNIWGLFFHFFRVKKILNFFFDPKKVKKRTSKVAHNWPRPFYFTVQPRPTAHSPELILHIMKSRDQTSVLLSVNWTCLNQKTTAQLCDGKKEDILGLRMTPNQHDPAPPMPGKNLSVSCIGNSFWRQ